MRIPERPRYALVYYPDTRTLGCIYLACVEEAVLKHKAVVVAREFEPVPNTDVPSQSNPRRYEDDGGD